MYHTQTNMVDLTVCRTELASEKKCDLDYPLGQAKDFRATQIG